MVYNFLYFDLSKVASNIYNYFRYGLSFSESSCCSVRAYTFEDMVSFFIYNTIKIFLLLSVLIFVISIIKSYFPPEKIGKYFNKNKKSNIFGNIIGALLGIVTPFCTCSAVTLFIGFVEAGVPLGATFSFLVSAPMINEVALVMLIGTFGAKIAVIYIFTGLITAVISGLIIGKLEPKRYIEGYIFETKVGQVDIVDITFKQRLKDAVDYVIWILKRVWVYVIVGMLIGSYMHGFIPSQSISQYIQKSNPLSVVVATIIGIPIYSNAAGIIPVVNELIRLGIPMGTGLAFMMSVTALSLPELIILRNVMKPRLISIFTGIIAIAIIIVGYIFNLII